MNIPSNFTLDEVLQVLPESPELEIIKDRLEIARAATDELETAFDKLLKSSELIEEQLNFATELVDVVRGYLKETGTKKELVTAIRIAIENSSLEI